MQLTLLQSGAVSAVAPVARAMPRESKPVSVDGGAPEPIVVNLSEISGQDGANGLLHSAAEFLIISISGCAPKR